MFVANPIVIRNFSQCQALCFIPDNAVMLLPIPGDLPCPWKVLHRGVHDGQVTLLEYQFRTGPDPGSCHDQNAQHHLVVQVTEELIDSVIEVDNVDVSPWGHKVVSEQAFNIGCKCYAHRLSVFWAGQRPSCRFKPYA